MDDTASFSPSGAGKCDDERAWEPMLAIALFLAYKRTAVHCCNPRTTQPRTPRSFKNATIDEDAVRGCWLCRLEVMPRAPTGKATKNLVVDPDTNDDGLTHYEASCQLGNGTPVTRTAVVSTAGEYLFSHRLQRRSVGNWAGQLVDGIDIRGGGRSSSFPPMTSGSSGLSLRPINERPIRRPEIARNLGVVPTTSFAGWKTRAEMDHLSNSQV